MSLVKANRAPSGDQKYVVGPYNLNQAQLASMVNSGVSEAVTANKTLVASDSGKTLFVNPTATTLIQLPSAVANPDWKIRIYITEGDGGTMDQKVNIGTYAGEFFNGVLVAADASAGVVAASTNDFITCSTSSTSGEFFDIMSNGVAMYCTGVIFDATDTLFADAAG